MERCHPKLRPFGLKTTVALACAMTASLLFSTGAGATAPLTASVVAAAPAPVLVRARKALLRLSDMPTGWSASRSSAGKNSDFPGTAQLARCIGVRPGVLRSNPPTVNSPSFASPNQLLGVSDNVSVYPSVRAALLDYTALANPRTPRCLQEVLNGAAKGQLAKQFGSGARLGRITVRRVAPHTFAPRGANYRAFIPLTTGGRALKVVVTTVDYVRGDEEQTVTFVAVDSSFPPGLMLWLTSVAASRL